MNDFPDILGMELHVATALLEAEGLAYIIAETKPTKKELPEGVLRVVRVTSQTSLASSEHDQSFVLTVCRI